MQKFNEIFEKLKNSVAAISSTTLEWIANIVLHCTTLPSLIAVYMGLTDKLPGMDLVTLVWGALTLLFIRAIIIKDMLNAATIGAGFIVQSTLMALIFFK